MTRNFSGTRVRKQWGSVGSSIINTASTNTTGIVAGFLARDESFTVMRLIGEYWIAPGAANVINDVMAISIGIGVVSVDAATLGGTAMPDPGTEPEYPWLYYGCHLMRMASANQDALGDPSMALRRTFDVHSMRKVKPREALVVVFQFEDINGSPTYDLGWCKTRVLVGI